MQLAYILAILAFLILIGLGTWLVIIIFSKEDEEPDQPFIFNFMSNYCEGRAIGTMKSLKKTGNGRYFIEYNPKDIDRRKLDKLKIKEIKPISLVVDEEKLLSFPKFMLSADKEILVALPKNATSFPEASRNNDFIRAMMWVTELQNVKKTAQDMLLEGNIRRDDLLKLIGTGEISKDFAAFQNELVKDALENVVNPRNKDKQNILPTPMNHGGLQNE